MSENNRIKQAGEYTLDKVELISYRRHQGEQTHIRLILNLLH